MSASQDIPDCFPPDQVAKLKKDHFYGMLPKCPKVMVAYLKVGTTGQDLLQLLTGSLGSGKGRFYGAVLESNDPDD